MKKLIARLKVQSSRFKVQGLLLLLLSIFQLFSLPAFSQVGIVPRYGAFTNGTWIANTSTLYSVSLTANLFKNSGVSLWQLTTGSNASAGNITNWIDVSFDGTNYTTTNASPFIWAYPSAGTAAKLAYTNIAPQYLNGVKSIRWTYLQLGGTNGIYVSNTWWSAFP